MAKRFSLGPHKMSQGIGAGFVPKNLNLDIVDDVEQVTSEDAFEMARKLSLEEGVFLGRDSTEQPFRLLFGWQKDRKWKAKNRGYRCKLRRALPVNPADKKAAAEVMDAVAEED